MTALIERQVGERLREVAEVAAAAGVELLGVEAERAGEREQLLAQRPGPAVLADLDQRRHEPERADRERALLAGEPVVGLLHAVAQHEAVDGELVGDGEHGGAHARVVGREEAEQRHEQQRRVERVGLVVLREDAALVERVGADVGVDLVGRRPATRSASSTSSRRSREPGAAVGRDPAHQLRRREVLRLAAHLPHAAVGLAPVRERRLDLALEDRPDAVVEAVAAPGVDVDRVEHRAPHVVLALVVGAVADAHRPGAVVAAEVVEGRAPRGRARRRRRT